MKLRVPAAALSVAALTAAVTTGASVTTSMSAMASSCPASSTSLSATQAKAVAAAKAKKEPVVLIKKCVFGKPSTTVKKGAKVLVVNEDDVPHTWESTVKAFDSGVIKGGGSKLVSIPKNAKSKYNLKCDIHSFMHGTLTIKVS